MVQLLATTRHYVHFDKVAECPHFLINFIEQEDLRNKVAEPRLFEHLNLLDGKASRLEELQQEGVTVMLVIH